MLKVFPKVIRFVYIFACVLSWVIPFVITMQSIVLGTFPFWYDPARDLLLAWGNLHKVTLIGPPSGIPGIFYGPYWIWWLSVAMKFSVEPQVIDFICLTVPYFMLFPFLLYKFSKIFGRFVTLLLWIFFIFSFRTYAFYIWNPHVAPVLTLLVCYFLIFADYTKKNKQTLLMLFGGGVSLGLLLNVHISFGSAVLLGAIVFLLLNALCIVYVHRKELLHQVSLLGIFICGFGLTYIPFFIFELRHGFEQIKTLIRVMTTPHAVVGYQGLSKELILNLFFGRIADIFSLPTILAYIFFGIGVVSFIFLFMRKKIRLEATQIHLIGLCLTILLSTLAIYLSTKNPVWNYHFIGIEVPFLLLIGIILRYVKFLQAVAWVWGIYIVGITVLTFIQFFSSNPMIFTSLRTQEDIVNRIYQDAHGKKFSIYAYNPAIYTYEYDYLFLAVGTKNKYSLPQKSNTKTIYLILPNKKTPVLEDFIHAHIPLREFTITQRWVTQDQTLIIKATKE